MIRQRPVYKSGKRPYLTNPEAIVRSGMEANCLLWLDHLGIKWEYEKYSFPFAPGTRGKKRYLPDIYIPNYRPTKKNGLPDLGLKEMHVEVKGYLDSRDRMCLTHFIRDWPEEATKLVAITLSPTHAATKYFKKKGIPILAYYKDLMRDFSNLEHWGE